MDIACLQALQSPPCLPILTAAALWNRFEQSCKKIFRFFVNRLDQSCRFLCAGISSIYCGIASSRVAKMYFEFLSIAWTRVAFFAALASLASTVESLRTVTKRYFELVSIAWTRVAFFDALASRASLLWYVRRSAIFV